MAVATIQLTETFHSVEEAIEALKNGEVIIVADDENRENEGDFVCAAEKVTPEIINFMVTHGKGLVCLALSPEICERLALPLMVPTEPGDLEATPFTVTIDADARLGCGTGISARDRALTIQTAIRPDSKPSDFKRPGHVFPLWARSNGVMERGGQTEASTDLARLAGFSAAGVLCEILNPDGTLARRNDLFKVACQFGLKFITVPQIVEYRKKLAAPGAVH